MSPTIYRFEKYRFFFNSREEERKHVHVATSDGTAKFWLEPIICMANYYGLSTNELKEIQKIVEEKQEDFKNDWIKHFSQ
jgi:hypothetical protein